MPKLIIVVWFDDQHELKQLPSCLCQWASEVMCTDVEDRIEDAWMDLALKWVYTGEHHYAWQVQRHRYTNRY